MATAQFSFFSESQGPLRMAGASHINEGCSQCQFARNTDKAAVESVWPTLRLPNAWIGWLTSFSPPWLLSFLHLLSPLASVLCCLLPLQPSSCSVIIPPFPLSRVLSSFILCSFPFLHCLYMFLIFVSFVFFYYLCAFPPLIAIGSHCNFLLVCLVFFF